MRRSPEERFDHYKRLLSLRNPQQPIADFCRRHGISVWTYYYWLKRIASHPKRAVTPVRQSAPPFVPIALPTSMGFEALFPNGIRIRSTQQLDQHLLSSIASVKVDVICSG